MYAVIVVLGDIGRSPRMTFHTLSLASHNCRIDKVGYPLSTPHSTILNNGNIRLLGISPPPDLLQALPRTLAYALKLIWSFLLLLFTLLFRVGFPDFIFLQNPPGIPAMLVCWLVCRLKGARFIIDWHNYTYSILEWTHTRNSWLVQKAEQWESTLGPKADLNFCVTNAMRADLLERWNINAVTLYDRPPQGLFKPLSDEEKDVFFGKMANEYHYQCFMAEAGEMDFGSTRFSSLVDSDEEAELRADRPALLVSGTSWTEDEDFSILLNALEKYDALATSTDLLDTDKSEQLPSILAVITGKGPMKSHYLELIDQMQLNNVEFLTPWLEAEDYPKILGSADIGVSLHMSTSELDLPMKVVDMFGCGLPVLAKNFGCLDELVKSGENGQTFETDAELADLLVELLRGFPTDCKKLEGLRKNLMDCPIGNWENNWDANVWPLL